MGIHTMDNGEHKRREGWFNWYTPEVSKEKPRAVFRDRFLCPCCNMPTIGEQAGFEICTICNWEDDGQDTDDADVVKGGPNGDYSLSEARTNFERHFTKYRPEEHSAFQRVQCNKGKREELYRAYTAAMGSNSDSDWQVALTIKRTVY
jgi:hypothetical protein